MLSGPIRPCLFEFMFLGSSGSLFLKIEKKGCGHCCRRQTVLDIAHAYKQHMHSLAKASSSDVTVAVAEPEMT